jgi:hypothetical protein
VGKKLLVGVFVKPLSSPTQNHNIGPRPPLSSGLKSNDEDSDEDAERSPIETQIAFEVVDENEAFWKLFPTKSTGVS